MPRGELAALYPRVAVDPNVLFVDHGKILTSAGAAAGIDLCLHMVRQDYGAAVAANAARLALVPLLRDGGQAQYIAHEPSRMSTALAPVLEWMDEHLEGELSLATIADRARTSTRTLSRRFKEQTGMTPLGWVLGARVRRAQALLESTTATIEEIAAQVGFESAATLRGHFHRLVGVNPTTYRRTMWRKERSLLTGGPRSRCAGSPEQSRGSGRGVFMLPWLIPLAILALPAWTVMIVVDAIRRHRQLRLATEFHARLLERIGSVKELAEFLGSEGGASSRLPHG